MKTKSKQSRKINFTHLVTMILICFIFCMAIFLVGMGIYQAFFAHNYHISFKTPLMVLPHSFLKEEYLAGDMYKSYEDEEYYSTLGVDVSSYQGDIDWQKVKESGVDFAYIRVGYRGYKEGTLNKDELFEKNVRAAKKAGLKVGVYFFSQAVSQVEAIDEAYFVRNAIRGLDIDLPIAYDLEDIDYDQSRIDELTNDEKTLCALSFAAKIEEFGYKPMIYTNLEWSIFHYDLSQIMNYDIWFAQYNKLPYFDYAFKVWQYTDHGVIPGISEPVDLNIMLIKK